MFKRSLGSVLCRNSRFHCVTWPAGASVTGSCKLPRRCSSAHWRAQIGATAARSARHTSSARASATPVSSIAASASTISAASSGTASTTSAKEAARARVARGAVVTDRAAAFPSPTVRAAAQLEPGGTVPLPCIARNCVSKPATVPPGAPGSSASGFPCTRMTTEQRGTFWGAMRCAAARMAPPVAASSVAPASTIRAPSHASGCQPARVRSSRPGPHACISVSRPGSVRCSASPAPALCRSRESVLQPRS